MCKCALFLCFRIDQTFENVDQNVDQTRSACIAAGRLTVQSSENEELKQKVFLNNQQLESSWY